MQQANNRRAVGVVGPLNIHDVFDYIRDALKPYYRCSTCAHEGLFYHVF